MATSSEEDQSLPNPDLGFSLFVAFQMAFFIFFFLAQLRNVVLDENLPLSEQWENSVRLFLFTLILVFTLFSIIEYLHPSQFLRCLYMSILPHNSTCQFVSTF